MSRRFTVSEKLEAVRQVEAGRDMRAVADDLGVVRSTVYRWCQEYPHAELLIKGMQHAVPMRYGFGFEKEGN